MLPKLVTRPMIGEALGDCVTVGGNDQSKPGFVPTVLQAAGCKLASVQFVYV